MLRDARGESERVVPIFARLSRKPQKPERGVERDGGSEVIWGGVWFLGEVARHRTSFLPSPLAGEGSERSERVRGKLPRGSDVTPHPAAKRGHPLPQGERAKAITS